MLIKFGIFFFTFVAVFLFATGLQAYAVGRRVWPLRWRIRRRHYGWKYVLAWVGLAGLVLSCIPGWEGWGPLGIVFLLAFFGQLILPQIQKRWRVAKQARQRENQLPEALELIARTLQAGLSLRQGLEVAARQIPAPLGSDLQQVMHRVELGESARDALAGLAASWGNKDFLTFVFATRISRKTGANLPQIVNRITAMIRERFRLRQKMAALTAQGKLSAWIIGFLPPALLGLMAFIDPPLIRDFFALPISWAVLFAALLWETLGIFVINKMVRLEL